MCHSFSDAVCGAAGCWLYSLEHAGASYVDGCDMELLGDGVALSFLGLVVGDGGLE